MARYEGTLRQEDECVPYDPEMSLFAHRLCLGFSFHEAMYGTEREPMGHPMSRFREWQRRQSGIDSVVEK